MRVKCFASEHNVHVGAPARARTLDLLVASPTSPTAAAGLCDIIEKFTA